MGNWFSNFHVRKSMGTTETAIIEYICEMMASQQYSVVDSAAEADGAFAIISDDKSQWYSVCSDLISFEDPKVFAEYASPMSLSLETDILGISCFDSDFLYMNLINANGKRKVNAWTEVGLAPFFRIPRLTNFSAWKKKVDNFDCFKKSVRKYHVFAEDILSEVEHCLRLPCEYSMVSFEHLDELGADVKATHLYFRLNGSSKQEEKPRLVRHTATASPCYPGKPALISVINKGAPSKGLSVYFLGPFVEHDELTFSDVSFVVSKGNTPEYIPVELQKKQLSDGRWTYYYHAPEYVIPPKVDDRLPPMKRMDVEHDRAISLRFVPQGNARKILDITIVLVTDKNPDDQFVWNIWRKYGSKKAFIDAYNEGLRRSGSEYWEETRLREEDFD